MNTRDVHPKEKPFEQDESTSTEPSSLWKTEGLAKMPLKVYNSQLAKLQPAEYQKKSFENFLQILQQMLFRFIATHQRALLIVVAVGLQVFPYTRHCNAVDAFD